MASMTRKKKRSSYPDITGSFSQEGGQNRIQKGTRTHSISLRFEWSCSLPSASYCWRSLALPSPAFSPSSSQQLFLPVHLLSAPVWQLFKVLFCKIKNIFKIFFVCYRFLCEKYYKPITVQYSIADCVSWVPMLTLLDLKNKLDLGMHSFFFFSSNKKP